MYRFILLVIAGAVMASAQRPAAALLWAQVAVTPPGSNPTATTDVVPQTPPPGSVPNGAPGTAATGGVAGVITGGVVAVPGAVQPGGGANVTGGRTGAPSGAPSIITGPAPGGAPTGLRGPGGIPGGTATPGSAGSGNAGGTGSPLPPKTGPAGPECHPILTASRAAVGAEGGVVQIGMNPLAAHCVPDIATSTDWLQLKPDATRTNQFTFLVAPNTSSQPRVTTVRIDQAAFTVEQRGLIRTRLAASPARVLLGMSPKRTPLKRELAIWADDSAAVLAVSSNAKWLQVQAKKTRKNGSRTFDVVVDPASLGTDIRHEAAVIVSTDGGPPLTVPVIVEGISNR